MSGRGFVDFLVDFLVISKLHCVHTTVFLEQASPVKNKMYGKKLFEADTRHNLMNFWCCPENVC